MLLILFNSGTGGVVPPATSGGLGFSSVTDGDDDEIPWHKSEHIRRFFPKPPPRKKKEPKPEPVVAAGPVPFHAPVPYGGWEVFIQEFTGRVPKKRKPARVKTSKPWIQYLRELDEAMVLWEDAFGDDALDNLELIEEEVRLR